MNDTLEISHGQWGYVTHMSDFSGGQISEKGKTRCGEHELRIGFDGHVMPGVADKELLGNMPGGYGFVRPWSASIKADDERSLNQKWDTMRCRQLDYYVALFNGSPDAGAVQLYYPERLFITGETEEGDTLSRPQLLAHMKRLGIRAYPEAWNPVQIFHGLDKGLPVFTAGLKADTDQGETWYGIKNRIAEVQLAGGCQWDYFGGALYGHLHVPHVDTYVTEGVCEE